MQLFDNPMIEIVIPAIPDRTLGPNASRHIHWGTRTRIRDEFRQTVLMAALSARQQWERRNGRPWVPMQRARLQVCVYVDDRRHIMDDDNAIAAIKAGRDALQVQMTIGRHKLPGAGIIMDDRGIVSTTIEWRGVETMPMMRWVILEVPKA